MQNAVLVGLSREVALERELSVVANNIANMNTNGYKADGSVFEEYLSSRARGAETGSRVSFVQDRGIWHDMSSGSIEQTGNPLDATISGQGFFVVQTPNGERYTRNGSFQINADGELVTSDGYEVLGDGGPIRFQRNDRQIEISPDGTISVREGTSIQDSQRGKLRLVNFANLQQLHKEGKSLFTADSGAQSQPVDTTTTVIQGSIEKSNVHAVVEMSRMIEITRSYAQVAAMLQQQADLGQSSIDKLADVPA
ncbi:MAG TPA: flagellar basal-body rod protein FlgF [Pseudolabrys sp.]|nr:flagellar basal-body rod protein FlgF [Pseudolabrys sp.]